MITVPGSMVADVLEKWARCLASGILGIRSGEKKIWLSVYVRRVVAHWKMYLQKKYQDQRWKYPIVNQLSWANSRIECSYGEIMYHWTVRESDCWSWEDVSPVLEDARYGKWRGPWPAPHTILPLSTIYIEPSSTSLWIKHYTIYINHFTSTLYTYTYYLYQILLP